MKRHLVLATALSLLAGGIVSADAAPRDAPRRTVWISYDQPAVYSASCGGCQQVKAFRSEHYVTVEVLDAVSPVGHVDLAWEVREDDEDRAGYVVVCGRTPKPLKVPPGRMMTVYTWGHPGPECPGGASTRGKVKLTFSARP